MAANGHIENNNITISWILLSFLMINMSNYVFQYSVSNKITYNLITHIM